MKNVLKLNFVEECKEFFRASAEDKIKEFGISGFVKNEPDRSIYMEVEEEPLDQFLGWCRVGSPLAIVEDVDYVYE